MSDKSAFPSDAADKVLVRMPDGMRDRLKTEAKTNNRTMNAEIVARLLQTFGTSGSGEVTLRIKTYGGDHPDPLVNKLLSELPLDLSSQYGLRLYREELRDVNQELEQAYADYNLRYAELQVLLGNSDGPDGPKIRKSEAVDAQGKVINQLKRQIESLETTIQTIHYIRRNAGLRDLQNLQMISTAVTSHFGDAGKPKKAPQ